MLFDAVEGLVGGAPKVELVPPLHPFPGEDDGRERLAGWRLRVRSDLGMAQHRTSSVGSVRRMRLAVATLHRLWRGLLEQIRRDHQGSGCRYFWCALSRPRSRNLRAGGNRCRTVRADRHYLRPQDRHPLGGSSGRDGLRVGHDLLAAVAGLAGGRCVGSPAPRAAGTAARRRQAELEQSLAGQHVCPGERRDRQPARIRRIAASRAAGRGGGPASSTPTRATITASVGPSAAAVASSLVSPGAASRTAAGSDGTAGRWSRPWPG